MILCQSVS